MLNDLFRNAKLFFLFGALLIAVFFVIGRLTYHDSTNDEPSSVIVEESAETAIYAEKTTTTANSTASDAHSKATNVTETVTEPEIIYGADVPYISARKLSELKERTAFLSQSCPDFIGWLYIADSDIDLPVVQGTDNFYYLTHAPDGTYNRSGTIFLDCSSSRDLSDLHNILFGHNMRAGMFGDIRYFKNRSEFSKHRYGWLVTPNGIDRIDFFALSVVSAYDDVYDMGMEHSQWLGFILDNALFTSDEIPAENDRIIALSTCSSEFGDARALFAGKLVHIDNEDEIIAK